MRKYHQKKLLELTKTLQEAHDEIRSLYFDGKAEAVIGLLSDCQESAISMGEFIEQHAGEGTKTVSALEEYCELLYRLSVSISDAKSDDGLLKQIRKKLFVIENSIRTELKADKIEVAFLPYKASMWDSMESVWLEAKSDPQCDAYVVPIPYYDCLPGGTFGEMHYEGGRYPDYVPVVDWQTYDIATRHPDIIFIHNPYDSGNYVASVHPAYYSKKLKEHTELLVYIPYFVVSDDVPEPFCVCAGTLNADKVFVQSERIRNTYIRVFREFEKKNRCAGQYGKASAKFISSGSPKFDKVINSAPEDFSIPEEWRRLIERPDGTKKPVVLYNTTVGAILQGNEQYLKKLRSVLDTFRRRDDAVLWWRPHPLNEATYGAMRPHLLDEYKLIVEEYRRQGFGIYDDTPDLHRAIQLSSFYFGDNSSLIALYQCTGKPVVVQNITVADETENQGFLTFEVLYDDGDNLWFAAININGLFRMDKQTWKAEYKESIGESQSGRLYSFITGHTGKLFFAPLEADAIGVYDPAEGRFSRIEIAEPRQKASVKYNPLFKFSFAAAYKEWVFFFPNTYPAILRYNVQTGELDYCCDCIGMLDMYANCESALYFRNGHVSGSEVTMYCVSAGAIVVFDMETCSVKEIVKCESKDVVYAGICYDGRSYWISPWRGEPSVIKLDAGTGERIEIKEFPPEFIPEPRRLFLHTAYAAGYVRMLPGLANQSIKINVKTNKIEIDDVFQAENVVCDKASEQWKFSFLKGIGDKLYAFDQTVNKLIEYDTENGAIRKDFVRVDKTDPATLAMLLDRHLLPRAERMNQATDCIIYESDSITLNDFINFMQRADCRDKMEAILQRQAELRRKEISHSDGKAGEAIYNDCKKEVIPS